VSADRLHGFGLLITLALGLLVAPLAAAAPPPGKVSRIAYLSAGSPARPSMPTAILDAFRQGLQELGWRYGQNLVVEYRWAEWRFERLLALATELAQQPVDLLLVGSRLELLAAKQATRTIPIVRRRRGGERSHEEAEGEGDEELVPGNGCMAVLACQDPAPGQDLRMPAAQGWEAMQRTAHTLGVLLQYLEVREPDDYHEAFAAAIRERAEAMVVFNCYFHTLNGLRPGGAARRAADQAPRRPRLLHLGAGLGLDPDQSPGARGLAREPPAALRAGPASAHRPPSFSLKSGSWRP
jgi:hypothetical protein